MSSLANWASCLRFVAAKSRTGAVNQLQLFDSLQILLKQFDPQVIVRRPQFIFRRFSVIFQLPLQIYHTPVQFNFNVDQIKQFLACFEYVDKTLHLCVDHMYSNPVKISVVN